MKRMIKMMTMMMMMGIEQVNKAAIAVGRKTSGPGYRQDGSAHAF